VNDYDIERIGNGNKREENQGRNRRKGRKKKNEKFYRQAGRQACREKGCVVHHETRGKITCNFLVLGNKVFVSKYTELTPLGCWVIGKTTCPILSVLPHARGRIELTENLTTKTISVGQSGNRSF
jgi:hypothetical protein